MPYLRQRQRVAATGRITVRLTPEQRDFFIGSPALPKNLGHALHRAAVRQGKLAVRLTRDELDALIVAAAKTRVPDRQEERALATLVRYLDRLEDRFEEPEDEIDSSASDDSEPR